MEPLEHRSVLSAGPDGSMVDAAALDTDQIKAMADQPHVVVMKLADLAADGIIANPQAGGPQDRITALRFDKYILIGDQFYQYASGKGYPLIPVRGPQPTGDGGVVSSPAPVVLPNRPVRSPYPSGDLAYINSPIPFPVRQVSLVPPRSRQQ